MFASMLVALRLKLVNRDDKSCQMTTLREQGSHREVLNITLLANYFHKPLKAACVIYNKLELRFFGKYDRNMRQCQLSFLVLR